MSTKAVYVIESRNPAERRWWYSRTVLTLRRAREVVRNERSFWEREARITKFTPASQPRKQP